MNSFADTVHMILIKYNDLPVPVTWFAFPIVFFFLLTCFLLSVCLFAQGHSVAQVHVLCILTCAPVVVLLQPPPHHKDPIEERVIVSLLHKSKWKFLNSFTRFSLSIAV
jgi:hypothetical protein